MGQISFEYPNGWFQSSNVGDFNNGTLYSEVTFTSTFENSEGISGCIYHYLDATKSPESAESTKH